MTFEDLLDRLWLFDFEVTQYDWLLVLNRYRDDKEVVFHNSLANDVNDFIESEQPILIGHNAKYYDQYILKSILSGFTMNEIKDVNDYLMSGKGQGFEIDYDYNEQLLIWDTIQDIVPQKSLKEIEANLLLDITESSIDFNIDHKWNEKEYEEMLFYCRADVKALKPLFEARIGYFETKFDICKLSNIDPQYNIGLTNAKLCAKFLEATKIERDDEREYVIPSVIDTSVIDWRILNFFSKIHDKSIPNDELFKSKLTFNEHGMPTVVSWGGKHGALPNYYYNVVDNPNIILINADVASLYPHLLALPQYNFISRNIKDKQKYYDTLQKRLELKHLGKKKEQLALKLILNTTYGCELNKYNDLYDPLKARSTCITGQLLISELSEKVFNIGDVKLVQVNTDGLMVEIPKNKLETYYNVCRDFSKKCGIELEYDIIDKIYQRDVNNYIMCYGEEGHKKIKAKGGCFSSLPKLEITEDNKIISKYEPNFKSNSLAIVSEALAKFLINNTPIEDTINDCDIIHKFQQVSHLGSTYEKCVQESPNGDIKLQKNNRIYAGKKPSGTIVKVKPNATTALYEIGVMIGENQLEVNGGTLRWLKNPSSYEADDPEYKIKALAFLSGPDADRYGELDLVPQLIKKIVQEKKSTNIKVMLSDWQTKEGSDGPSSEGKVPQSETEKARATKTFKSLLNTFNRGKVKYDEKKAREVFDKYYRVGDTVDEIALKVIENGGVASS